MCVWSRSVTPTSISMMRPMKKEKRLTANRKSSLRFLRLNTAGYMSTTAVTRLSTHTNWQEMRGKAKWTRLVLFVSYNEVKTWSANIPLVKTNKWEQGKFKISLQKGACMNVCIKCIKDNHASHCISSVNCVSVESSVCVCVCVVINSVPGCQALEKLSWWRRGRPTEERKASCSQPVDKLWRPGPDLQRQISTCKHTEYWQYNIRTDSCYSLLLSALKVVDM